MSDESRAEAIARAIVDYGEQSLAEWARLVDLDASPQLALPDETDEQFRKRVVARLKNLPRAGIGEPDYDPSTDR